MNVVGLAEIACPYLSGFRNLESKFCCFPCGPYIIINTLAITAIAATVGLISSCVNKGANYEIHAFNLGISAASAAACWNLYQYLSSHPELVQCCC